MARAVKSPTFIPKSEVLKRGWSDSMVSRILGAPDKEAPNPYHKSGPLMKLYDKTRVLRKEQTKAFQAAHAKLTAHAINRKAGAQKALATKAAATAALIDQSVITVKVIEREELVRLARAHQRSRQGERELWRMARGDFEDDYSFLPSAGGSSETDFDLRITVNYVRHQLTKYDAACTLLISKIGRTEAYQALRSKVFDAITEAYPWLADECDRQLFSR